MTTTIIPAEPGFSVVTARVAKLTPGDPADDLVTVESWPVVDKDWKACKYFEAKDAR